MHCYKFPSPLPPNHHQHAPESPEPYRLPTPVSSPAACRQTLKDRGPSPPPLHSRWLAASTTTSANRGSHSVPSSPVPACAEPPAPPRAPCVWGSIFLFLLLLPVRSCFSPPLPHLTISTIQPFTIAISSSIDGTGAEVLSSRASPSITIAPSVSFVSLSASAFSSRDSLPDTPRRCERLRSILYAASSSPSPVAFPRATRVDNCFLCCFDTPASRTATTATKSFPVTNDIVGASLYQPRQHRLSYRHVFPPWYGGCAPKQRSSQRASRASSCRV